MAEFSYKAIDSYGKIHKGVVQAKNDIDVEFRLENQGYDLISCKPYRRLTFSIGTGHIPNVELINMLFHLEQLISSGVPLLDGLTDLRDSVTDNYFKNVLAGIVEAIEGGKNFSAALKEFPDDFDDVFVALISVGEESGELPKVLHKMGETMRRSEELLARAKKVMMYPSIVGLIIVAVTAFLFTFLVPKIVPFVEQLGGDIPFHTQLLIDVSKFTEEYWWLVLSVPLVISVVIGYLIRSNAQFRFFMDGVKLRIPVFGPMSFKIKLTRFSTYMALLYGSGITVLRSIEICESLIDNAYMRKSITQARQEISDGGGISESFTHSQIFPPLVIRMLKVGETTGNLDAAMLNVSYFYDREVQEAIEKIEPAIGPLMTVVMAVLLGWIMISVLGPVWNAATGIG